MSLTLNEKRKRAAKFARDWEGKGYEKGEMQPFYVEFFNIFGRRAVSVASFEKRVIKLDSSSGYIDLFWPGRLVVEQKSKGRNLDKARDQAHEYILRLKEHQKPEYMLFSDFQTFELDDLENGTTTKFNLSDLPEYVKHFSFMDDEYKRKLIDQRPANIEASDLVGELHDALDKSGYRGNALGKLLVRIVFCLFADDTGIFDPPNIFMDFIEGRTREDGSDTGARLIELFQVLNETVNDRQSAYDEDLNNFPYINGDLFSEQLRIPAFDSIMRDALIDACYFDWSNISPAIFGALFQSVMDPVERRTAGAHYTTEENILKVIDPLFMDDLRTEFNHLKGRKDSRRVVEIMRFRERLGKMKFFDPACGCGNFLIIAYRELRELEMDVLKEITDKQKGISDIDSRIDVDQFYGIEISEFPVRIAETALWMMDHIMNNRLTLEFERTYTRIPLERSPHIINADALETNWNDLLPARDCSYVFGNPPYGGAKVQSPEQRGQVRRIAALGKRGGTLDYVAAWFIKAGDYIQTSNTRIGFVSTNSITQGEQVGQLWPILFDRYNLEIAFAHRTFAWGSDVSGQAHVHVVIIGLDKRDHAQADKHLFSYPDMNGEPEKIGIAAISPYLFDAKRLSDPHLVVREESKPINGMARLITGTQPLEDGHLTFSTNDKAEFIEREPGSAPYFHLFPGAKEFIRGEDRWILHTTGIDPQRLRALPLVSARLKAVREFRMRSNRKTTKRLADYPSSYGVTVVPESPFLIIPQTSSERREYVPMGWLEPPVIPSEKLRLLPNATLIDFALLTSAMHMSWMRVVTGRLESRYMYSVGVVYNTFPMPPEGADMSRLEPLAQAVLDARVEHKGASLADLYDPVLMPPNLRKAHQALDRAVDRLYRKSGFKSERERIEHLFALYEKMR